MDPMTIVFAIQFVALIGQLSAPIESSFRKLTLSFSWANLQFQIPDWFTRFLSWISRDKNIDGKLSYGFSNPVPPEELPEGYEGEPPSYVNGQEAMLTTRGKDAEDLLLGNVFSVLGILISARVLHFLLADALAQMIDRKREKKKALKEKAAEVNIQELAEPIPPKFELPPDLSWRKVFLLIISISHMGLCQSCMVVLSNWEASSSFICGFALIVFLTLPVGFSVLTLVTLKGVKDMSAPLPLFSGHTYAGVARFVGTIPKEMQQDDIKFIENKGNKAAGMMSTLTMQGEWVATTKEAQIWQATYSPLFSKYTNAGFVLTGVSLVQKILQALFLSYVGTPSDRTDLEDEGSRRFLSEGDGAFGVYYNQDDALLQLIGLQLISVVHLAILVTTFPFRDRLKNISEIIIEASHLVVWMTPLISMFALDMNKVSDMSNITPHAIMFTAVVAGVGTALAKEFICLAPVLALQLGSTAFGAVFGFPEDPIKKAQQRRDVQQAISSLSQDGQSQAQTIVAAVRPQLLSCIEPTVEPLRALVSTTLEETSKWQEDFVSGGKNEGKSFPRRRVYRAGYIAADPGLRAACTDNLAGLYKKQGGAEPSDEKIKKKEAKALAEEAMQGFAAPTKKMDLLECQTCVELLAEEMALAQAMVRPPLDKFVRPLSCGRLMMLCRRRCGPRSRRRWRRYLRRNCRTSCSPRSPRALSTWPRPSSARPSQKALSRRTMRSTRS